MKLPCTAEEYLEFIKSPESLKFIYQPMRDYPFTNAGILFMRTHHNPKEDGWVFVTSNIVDMHLMGSMTILSPLLTAHRHLDKLILKHNAALGVSDYHSYYHDSSLNLKDLWGFTYFILNHKGFLTTYQDKLRITFPQLPFIYELSDYLKYSSIGNSLLEFHLQTNVELANYLKKDPPPEHLVPITKPTYDRDNGILHLNPELSLHDIPWEVYNWRMGEVAALPKLLNSYKNDKLSLIQINMAIDIIKKTVQCQKDISAIPFTILGADNKPITVNGYP